MVCAVCLTMFLWSEMANHISVGVHALCYALKSVFLSLRWPSMKRRPAWSLDESNLIVVYFIIFSTIGCCCTVKKNWNLGWKKYKPKMLDLLFSTFPNLFQHLSRKYPIDVFFIANGWISILATCKINHSCFRARMDVYLFAPYDSELNPEGEVKKEKVPPETSLQAKKGRCQTNWVPGRNSLQGTSPEESKPRRRRTRWDASPKPYYKPPGHWREMTQVGGRPNGSLEEKLWREIRSFRRSSRQMLCVGPRPRLRHWTFYYTTNPSSR